MIYLGHSPDLRITSMSNWNSDSFSKFGWTFSLPQDLKYNSKEAKSYLAGSYYFKVKEIEVYQVRFS